jgi:hypothetical protein
VYVSCDVVFDETIFPFASLHPNAGACLRKEIELLPDVLKNSSSEFGMQLCLINHWLILYLLMLCQVVVVLVVMQEKTSRER